MRETCVKHERDMRTGRVLTRVLTCILMRVLVDSNGQQPKADATNTCECAWALTPIHTVMPTTQALANKRAPARAAYFGNAQALGASDTPNLRNMLASGHKLVKLD